jgi:hypothetical protein
MSDTTETTREPVAPGWTVTPAHIVRSWLYNVIANPPAAMAPRPSEPIITRSVVVRATWAS